MTYWPWNAARTSALLNDVRDARERTMREIGAAPDAVTITAEEYDAVAEEYRHEFMDDMPDGIRLFNVPIKRFPPRGE